MFLSLVALELLDDASCKQVHVVLVAREGEVLATVHDGRAGAAHVDLGRTGIVEEANRLAQLGAAHDRIVDEEQLLALDELGYGNELHLGDMVADGLVLRHERAWPGGRVLDERTGVGQAGCVGEADAVRDTRIGNAGNGIDVGQDTACLLVTGHDGAIAVAHDLDVLSLVFGVGIPIVNPQESAYLHVIARLGERAIAIAGDVDDLGGTELVIGDVTELFVGEGLEGRAVAVIVLADEDGQATHLVARRDDVLVIGHDEQRERSVDDLLGKLDARHEVLALVDERGDKLGRVDLAGAHGHELTVSLREVLVHELVGVVDTTYRRDGKDTQMRANEQGLRIRIADAADAAVAVKLCEVILEAGAKRRVLDRVNLALEALLIVEDHARPARAEMRMIVNRKEHVQHAIAFRRHATESTHNAYLSAKSSERL